MLTQLQVSNYAIIEELKINFSPCFNIITGETGAGKSILIGALSLILGERAETSLLLDKKKKCIIEGTFSMGKKPEIEQFLEQEGFDSEDQILIRREISVAGKTRAFINDSPANLQQLKQLASMLVDLHQQFDTLELGDAGFQREVLDALAANGALLKKYQHHFQQYTEARRRLDHLTRQQQQFQQEQDYQQFLFREFEELNLQPRELEEAEAELKLLSNAESIKQTLSSVQYALQEGEVPMVPRLKQLNQLLQGAAAFHPDIATLLQRLQSVHIELADIGDELEQVNDLLSLDAERMEKLSERMAAGYRLQKKHGVQTTGELLAIAEGIRGKLQRVLAIGEEAEALKKEQDRLLVEARQDAEELHKTRQAVVAPFLRQVNALLKKVGMPNAQLKVDIRPRTLDKYGADEIQFLFDANNTSRFEPIGKVASGGELSRLMLCIKSLVARSIDLPTLIFDEIDTGISGEAAKQVGIIMKELATARQVISITHQPQIAGRADAHFYVHKKPGQSGVIRTAIRQLDRSERVQAIAQMLSGEQPTAAALQTAGELVG